MTWLKGMWAAYRLPIILGGVAMALLIAGLLYVQGRRDGRLKTDAARAVANVEAMKKNETANTKAAEARVTDAEQVLELKEDLTDAVAEIPDSVPDATAVRLGCERLRRQGTDTAALPACR